MPRAAVRIALPPKLVPVFLGTAAYRGAFGGRGSAKTRSFAKMSAIWGARCAAAGQRGLIACGREFMNSLDDSSFAEVKAAIMSEPWLANIYEIGDKFIRTRDHQIDYAFVGLSRNLDSIKSRALIRLLWVDEAEPVSETAWSKAINTVREDGAEIWVTWNPERSSSATHKRFRLDPPSDAKIIELNWRDNPWFPKALNKKRLEDLQKRPETYDHIWEGNFAAVTEGAYYARHLLDAKNEGRIGRVIADPLIRKRAFWDIGGAGAKADLNSIWIAQWVEREIRIIDFIEGQGQTLSYYVQELRSRGHGDAICYLPHDGVNANSVTGKRYEDHLRDAEFEVEIIKNQGPGAAMMRIEAARRLFPRVWFNAETTESGREALGYYHERKDEKRSIGLGPEHDWSSNAADAFGLMCVAYEEPRTKAQSDIARRLRAGGVRSSWMAS